MSQNRPIVPTFFIKLISFFPMLILLYLIFGFSSQTGEESASLSFRISMYLVQLFAPFFPATSTNEIFISRAENIHFLVRKAAHMTEYFLLTLSLHLPMTACLKNRISSRQKLFLGFIGAVFLASADEFHQTFVSGRSGSLTDVAIDTIGITAATIFAFILYRLARSHTSRDTSHTFY